MSTAIHIKPVIVDDLNKIIDLGESLQDSERSYEPSLLFNRDESYSHYIEELANPDALIISATLEDGSIVGYQYSYIHTLDYLSLNNRECVLEALYVDTHYRGQGIGRLLTTYAQEWAINTKHVNRLTTHIYAGNEASIQLHEKDGFIPYNIELVKNI